MESIIKRWFLESRLGPRNTDYAERSERPNGVVKLENMNNKLNRFEAELADIVKTFQKALVSVYAVILYS